LPEAKQGEIIEQGLMAKLVQLTAEAESGSAAQQAARRELSGETGRKQQVRVLGFPEAEAEALLNEVKQALQAEDLNAGVKQRLEILQQVFSQARGPINEAQAIDAKWEALLAEAVRVNEASRVQQSLNLGPTQDKEAKYVFAVAGGLKVEDINGMAVMQPKLIEANSAQAELFEKGRAAADIVATLYQGRPLPAQLQPATPYAAAASRMMLAMAKVSPSRLRTGLHQRAEVLDPQGYWTKQVLAQVPEALQKNNEAAWQALTADLNSAQPIPLAIRERVQAGAGKPGAGARANLAKRAFSLIVATQAAARAARSKQAQERQEGWKPLEVAETQDMLLFSEVFRNLESVPTVEIAELDPSRTAEAFPGDAARAFVVPVALLEVSRARSTLGLISDKLGPLPFNIHDNVIRLFLRRGMHISVRESA